MNYHYIIIFIITLVIISGIISIQVSNNFMFAAKVSTVKAPTSCPTGQRLDPVSKKCIQIRRDQNQLIKPKPTSCPSGQKYNPQNQMCVPNTQICPTGQKVDPVSKKCVAQGPGSCPPGMIWYVNGQYCIQDKKTQPPTQPPTKLKAPQNCPPGMIWYVNGQQCIKVPPTQPIAKPAPFCDFPYVLDPKTNKCAMPPTQKPHCTYGQDSNGNCLSAPNRPCPNGLQWNQQFSRCVKPGSGNPYECPSGTKLNTLSNQCVDQIQTCPNGQIWSPNDQKCVTKTKLDICPEGSMWNYKTNACVPNYSASLAGLY